MVESKTIDLDKILVDEIGQFGKFQLRTLLISAVAVIFAGFHTDYVFTAARIPTRCLIPECENDDYSFRPPWISNVIPEHEGVLNSCQRYANLTRTLNNTSCPTSLFDRNALIDCENFVYENQLSVVYEFNLGCDEWRRSLIGTIRTVGTLLTMPITGYISDHWGRRLALALNAFNTFWIGLSRYWATNYFWFTFLQFAEATFGAGVFSCIHILVLELVGPKYRVVASAFLFTAFATGQAITALIAWVVPAWRPFTLALYLPQIVTIVYFWVLPESLRWYMSKGRYKEFEKSLKNVARVNGRQLSEESLELLRESSYKEKRNKNEGRPNKSDKWLVVRIFHYRRVLLRCMFSPLWWMTMSLIFHGLGINAVNMFGNPYLNFVLVSIVEIPGFWLSVLLLPRMGRRLVIIGGFLICSASQVAFIFISSEMYFLSMTAYLVGKCCISAVATALYIYTMELYPTEYRHSLFAYSSMIGRIGTITAPLTPAIGAATFYSLPFAMFGVMSFVSGLLVLLTPETLHTKLPDTLEEANNLGKKT